MKQKLRKLVHKSQEYLYRVNTAYNTKGDNASLLSVRIFLSGEKIRPCVFIFIPLKIGFLGNPSMGTSNWLIKISQMRVILTLNNLKSFPNLLIGQKHKVGQVVTKQLL